MMYINRQSHFNTLTSVQQEHESHCNLTFLLLDQSGNETFTSISTQFICYDDYERYDIALSQSVLESAIHNGLKNQVLVRFGQMDNFDFLPGSIYFMVVI